MATKVTKELRIKMYDDLFGDGELKDILVEVSEAKGYKILKYKTEGNHGVHRTLLPKEYQVGE
ncbi:hypothetical protein EalM132_00104 [Exiguobacterium phage vB_EalM-132]|nr:hypothetical protein EalM132_00104 [Exiguobacterium phage vB_EalM-132]